MLLYTVKNGVMFIIPMGYGNSVAIEAFDVVIGGQCSHGNMTITPRSINTTIGCYRNTFINTMVRSKLYPGIKHHLEHLFLTV